MEIAQMTPQKKCFIRVEGCDIMIILKYIRFRINPWCESTHAYSGYWFLDTNYMYLGLMRWFWFQHSSLHIYTRKKGKNNDKHLNLLLSIFPSLYLWGFGSLQKIYMKCQLVSIIPSTIIITGSPLWDQAETCFISSK